MRPEDNRSEVLTHMLGYVNEDQQADADSQGLCDDDIHLLGYLDTPHWIEATGMFTGENLTELKALAKRIDTRYNTNFHGDILENEVKPKTQRDLMIEKYTKNLANLKENQAREDEARTGGLTDLERHEYETLIHITAEVIRDLKVLPNL